MRLQRGYGHSKHHDRTITIANYETLIQTIRFLLMGQDIEVLQIDYQDHERSMNILPMILSFGEYT